MDRLDKYDSLIRQAENADREAVRLEHEYRGVRPGWVSEEVCNQERKSRSFRRQALSYQAMQ